MLTETGALPPGHELLGRLSSKYRYKVDPATGSVDWNRDNQFSPVETKVRAYANYAPGAGCEGTRAGEKPTGLTSNRSPAIVRFNNHLWVFAVTPTGELDFTMTPGEFSCTNPDQCPPLAFHEPGRLLSGNVSGIDAVTVTIAGRPIIVLAGIRKDGTLFEMWMEEISGRYHWHGPTDIPASTARNEPSLAVSSDGARIALAYAGKADSKVYYRFRTSTGYGPERMALSQGQGVYVGNGSSPSIAYARMALPGDITLQEQLIGAFISGSVRLYRFNVASQDWSTLPVPVEQLPSPASTLGRATGKPALAWVSSPSLVIGSGDSSPDPMTYGRLYVVYSEVGAPDPNHPKPNPVRMSMSYVDRLGRLTVGLDSHFDNVWSFAHGIDLLQPGELKLRAAETYVIEGDPWNRVYVRPNADGIVDVPYRNYDDWKVMAWGSCAVLSTVQAPQIRVNCASPGW
jgi:hypothetical protein